MLRVLLVDDEPLALRRLEIAFEAIPDCEIVGKACEAETACWLISQEKPDVILLDMEMPGMTGFQLIESIETDMPPAVIFVTAYEQYAVGAFDHGAIDYLLKPVDEARLGRALERAREERGRLDANRKLAELQDAIEAFENSESSPAEAAEGDGTIWVNDRGCSRRVLVREIRMLEAAGDYVAIHTEDEELLIHESLRRLEERLDRGRFARVHRSSIVALPFVELVERKAYGRLRIQLDNGAKAWCSRSFRHAFLDRIEGEAA